MWFSKAWRGPRKDSQAQPVSLYWSLRSEGTCLPELQRVWLRNVARPADGVKASDLASL